METVYETRARVFKALCDERRQRILELLQGGEKCACVLLEAMDMPQSSLSYHMKILCDSGIIVSREGSENAVALLREITAVTAPDEAQDTCG